MKSLYIAEKPSVAREFANALHEQFARRDGFLESENSVVTWCVGHLVTMSYPDKYDIKYKKWSLETIPFLPETFRYEIIPGVKKQFQIVKEQLNRDDVGTIYVCTDSGREGEYIYRLVAQMARVPKSKAQRRVWIDSQTEDEITRGIREAKDLTAYDNLSDAAYLRAKEDYLMGINFSRALSLRYAYAVTGYLGIKYQAISVGRVMTCVLGMVVRREREIRNFVKTPFYRVLMQTALDDLGRHGRNDGSIGDLLDQSIQGNDASSGAGEQGSEKRDAQGAIEAEWRVWEKSRYHGSPKLYKENGFKERPDAEKLIAEVSGSGTENPAAEDRAQERSGHAAAQEQFPPATVAEISRKTEKKNPPLLYNLAELQNDCSKRFKISPDQTLAAAQELYEKKLVTYPRTDARVLSSAIAKEIDRNLKGLARYEPAAPFAQAILAGDAWKKIGKSRYTNDKQITDHYAIIPTGQGFAALNGLSGTTRGVYDLIVRRFLAIFYPPAVYKKINLVLEVPSVAEAPGSAGEENTNSLKETPEHFHASFRVLEEEGYLAVLGRANRGKKDGADPVTGAEKSDPDRPDSERGASDESEEQTADEALLKRLAKIKKGDQLPVGGYRIREGETSPPKRYTSGSMILAMENAGQLIEDEELRAQIKGSGIGTSATRAEILKKLVAIKYLALNKKTQVITPTQMGEMVFDVVNSSIRALLNPELTASWEKGLTYVAEGSITSEEYMQKLAAFVAKHTENVKQLRNSGALRSAFDATAQYYKKAKRT